MPIFTPIQQDITTLKVSAIVNAANPSLLGGGGVDGAIHRAAGVELTRACAKLKGCKPGEAKITKGFKLPADFVIHTVGPVWKGGGHQEAQILGRCYQNSLSLASRHKLETIAFPAISCGVYGYPIDKAVAVATSACSQWLAQTPPHSHKLKKIFFVCFDARLLQLYRSACDSYSS